MVMLGREHAKPLNINENISKNGAIEPNRLAPTNFTNMLSERNDLRIDISKEFELEPYYRRAGSPTMMYLQTIMSLGAIVTPS